MAGRMARLRWSGRVGACVTASALAAGLLGGGASASAASKGSAPLQSVTVGINGYNGLQIPLIIAASEPKIMSKYGAKLDVILTSGEAAVMPGVASGSLDFGSETPEATIEARGKGVPVQMVTRTVQVDPETLLATKTIKTPKGLIGKTIGVGTKGVTLDWQTVVVYLGKLGIKPTQYNFLSTGTPAGDVAALAAGTAQATSTFQPGVGELVAKGYHVIGTPASLAAFRNIFSEGLVADTSWLSTHKTLAVDFLKGYTSVIKWMYQPAHKRQVLSDLAATAGFTATESLNVYNYFMKTKQFSPTEIPTLSALKRQLKNDKSATEPGLPTPTATGALKKIIDPAFAKAANK